MGRRYASCNASLPSAVFDQIIQQKCESLVRGNIRAIRINDAKAIGIPVSRNAKLHLSGNNKLLQLLQRFFGGFRTIASKIWIPEIMDHFHRATAFNKEAIQIVARGSPQRINSDLQTGGNSIDFNRIVQQI